MPKNIDLWRQISAIEFDQLESVFPFSKRLARDNNWSHDFALRAIEEYRKFAYLAIATGREVTPSDEVDQVWHLHLTYTRHYWGEFQQALGKPLHHGPTAGGKSEAERYSLNYDATLAAYEDEFGKAPRDIWPDAKSRFSDPLHFRRVNLKNKVLVPKWLVSAVSISPFAVGGALLSTAAAMTAAKTDNGLPFGLEMPHVFLIAFAALFVAIFVGAMASNKKGKGDGSGGTTTPANNNKDIDADGGDGGSGCGSGCGGCGGA